MTHDDIMCFATRTIGEELGEMVMLKEHDKLVELGLDSLALVKVTIELEDKFNVTFPKNLSTFKTVGDVVYYVEQQCQLREK